MAGDGYIRVDPVKEGILPQRLSVGDVLHNTGNEFSLFTAALLFTHGGFDRDPVVEFASYYSEVSQHRPACIDLHREHEFFFSGLGVRPAPRMTKTVNWDKRLYAIPKAAADDCFAFLGGIGWAQPRSAFFARTFSYPADIPDPTEPFGGVLPVRLFGVAANSFVVFIDTGTAIPTVRLINTNKPLDILQSLGADIEAYRSIANPFEGETGG